MRYFRGHEQTFQTETFWCNKPRMLEVPVTVFGFQELNIQDIYKNRNLCLVCAEIKTQMADKRGCCMSPAERITAALHEQSAAAQERRPA